jgi:subtilisin-like proprotein convertase family protein
MDVAISVQHPRISDLVFHLISPDGTRDLLMENRGGTDPNGAGGVSTVVTNVVLTNSFEGLAGDYTLGQTVAGWIVTANQVSVPTDPTNAYQGNNFLALANGTLSTTLTTVPGATYTLTFAYRGPDIGGWWRAENNVWDSIYGNTGTLENATGFKAGEVGNAFNLNGVNNFVLVNPTFPVGQKNGFTIEGWINPTSLTKAMLISEYERVLQSFNGNDVGVQFGFNSLAPGNFDVNIKDIGGGDHIFYSLPGVVTTNGWQHVALSYNKVLGMAALYHNGFLLLQTNLGSFTPDTTFTNLLFGARTTFNSVLSPNAAFSGGMDEMSIYDRALSDSEIQAIFADGAAGKFDPTRFSLSARQSLAEAQISVNGSALTNLFGNNTNWQTYTVSFIATQTSTPLQIQGIEPGMLLDAASVMAVITNYSYLVFTENTNLTTTPIKFAVPPLGPLAGYVQWPLSAGGNGHWYKAVANPGQSSGLTWAVADQIAQSEGGYLATVTSLAENDFVFSLINQPQFFTGGNLPGGNGAGPAIGGFNNGAGWTWENGDPWTWTPLVFPWYAFQPNDPPPTRIIYFSGTQGVPAKTWDDYGPNDHNTGGYVIERNSMPGFDLPEQSLADAYDGENALGTWTLEIQDDRVGATNPAPLLLSWQLRFNYVTGVGIPSGTTETNIIPPNGWTYYQINVPPNADYATNILVFATGPLNVWFNPANNPIGSTPPDSLLMGGSTGGSSTLSTFSTPTNIVPGGVYYIGLYNPNAFAVTNGFEVNFHYFQTTPLTPGVPVTNTVAGTISGDGVDYYSIAVPANADYATNLLLFSTQPVNVWFNQNKDPVCLANVDSLLIANATNGVAILSPNSVPPLMPGLTYYLAVQDTNASNATYALAVNFHFLPALTNGVPVTNTVPSNNFFYFTVTVPTNADYATNLLLYASLPVNVWFNQNGLPVGTNPPDSLLIGNATNGVSILSANTVPPLVPGATYYLGVQNTNAVPVNFALEVDFHLLIPNPITGPTITATNINGTNGFLLKWSGPTNYQYTIQWKTNLTSAFPWNTVSNPVINLVYIPPDGHYSWFDDGSLAGGLPPIKFYRVVADLLSGPITNSAPVTNVIVAGTITPLTVTVPANAIAASNLLISATGPVNVWFNQTNPPTGNTNAGDVLMLSTTTGGTFVLTGSSVPPLVPGANYYLGLQNPGTTNVTFVFQVNFGYASSSTNPPSISSITLTNSNGTNAVLLKWVAPTNYQFQVQWATNLAPAIAWHTISNVVLTWSGVVSPTNAAYGIFQYLDDGSLTGGWGPLKFYRLIEYPYSTPIPQTLTIINTAIIGGAVRFQWVAPTNYQYQILWTTNLGSPLASWSLLANPVLGLSNGVFTFTDTNQTGPPTSPKFFRLIEF